MYHQNLGEYARNWFSGMLDWGGVKAQGGVMKQSWIKAHLLI